MQQQTKTALQEKKHSTVGGILSSGILSGHHWTNRSQTFLGVLSGFQHPLSGTRCHKVLVSDSLIFSMARYGLFVLKEPLNPNQPTISDSLSVFKSRLKTFMFNQAFTEH